MEIQWNKYPAIKPVKAGVYLVANETTEPPLKAACYYYPIHGWTGAGHTLERLISYWAEFPPCPNSK
jgi:hypothetical protein